MTVKTYQQLYSELKEDGTFEQVAVNPAAQFGTEDEAFLGATILPEVNKRENSYEEDQVRYRVLPALDNTRYSPAQMQESGAIVGNFKVDFGTTDTAGQLTGNDHDGLVKLLQDSGDVEATAQVVNWADKTLVQPHLIKNEIQRWQAIIKCQVQRRGTNGYTEDVNYYAPAGHRPEVDGGTVAAPAGWFVDSYDPFEDIAAGGEKLESLGYRVTGMYATRSLIGVLSTNANVAKRTKSIVVNDGGQISGASGRATLAAINAALGDDELPAITKYNLGYRNRTGFRRFLEPDDTHHYLVMVANTGRDYSVDLGDAQTIELGNTLGYYGIGRNVGQSASGRTIHTEVQERKPQGLYGESYQTGLPVITEPDAIYVIRIKKPTP